MKVKKADDYQSWFIEEGYEALLIDPWFDFALVDGKGWFLQRKKEKKSHLTEDEISQVKNIIITCLLYTSPSPRDMRRSRMPSSA